MKARILASPVGNQNKQMVISNKVRFSTLYGEKILFKHSPLSLAKNYK